jgi:hypothetical protein
MFWRGILEVEAFLLADAATDQGGKLNVLGAFDSILAPTAPVGHPAFSIAMRIRFSKSESGNHPFRINIVNEDGKSILPRPLEGNIEVGVQNADESAAVNLVANFRDVRFEKFGKYSVDLSVTGKQRGSLPIYVRQAQRPG